MTMRKYELIDYLEDLGRLEDLGMLTQEEVEELYQIIAQID